MSWTLSVLRALVARHRRLLLASAGGYLLLYLYAIQDISPGGRGFAFRTTEWTRMFERIGPATFEPIAQIVVPGLTLLLSPLDIFIGLVLGGLGGLGVITARAALSDPDVGDHRGWLVAAATSLAGLACLGPGLSIVLKVSVPSSFVPFFQLLIPVSLVLLVGTTVSALRRLEP